MKAELSWNEKMNFLVQVAGFEVQMDAPPPFGEAKHPSPKQLLLSSMAGCTAMDVISLLKKYKQALTSFKMEVEAEAVTTQPQIFTHTVMNYFVEGEVESAKLIEAIHLSLSKFCSVNAMVSRVVEIRWQAYLNGIIAGQGKAEFNLE